MSTYPDNLPGHIKGDITKLRKYLKNHNIKSITIEEENVTFVYSSDVIIKYNADGTATTTTATTSTVTTPASPTSVSSPPPPESVDNITTIFPILNDMSLQMGEIREMLSTTTTASATATRTTTTTPPTITPPQPTTQPLPPKNNPTNAQAFSKIRPPIDKIIDIMIDLEETAELIPHPTETNDVLQAIRDLFEDCHRSDITSSQKNQKRFEAGYYSSQYEGGEHMDQNLRKFKDASLTYYNIIKSIVSNTCSEFDWKNSIKKKIFDVGIYISYFRDINSANEQFLIDIIHIRCRDLLREQRQQQQQETTTTTTVE